MIPGILELYEGELDQLASAFLGEIDRGKIRRKKLDEIQNGIVQNLKDIAGRTKMQSLGRRKYHRKITFRH